MKENAARSLRCHNWMLALQNRIVWRQKLWEAKARLLQAVVDHSTLLMGINKFIPILSIFLPIQVKFGIDPDIMPLNSHYSKWKSVS